LNNSVTELVISLEFVRKNKFKKKKLERLIYIRNINGIFNHKGLIEHTVKRKLFFKGHEERIEVDMIRGQKWSVILEML